MSEVKSFLGGKLIGFGPEYPGDPIVTVEGACIDPGVPKSVQASLDAVPGNITMYNGDKPLTKVVVVAGGDGQTVVHGTMKWNTSDTTTVVTWEEAETGVKHQFQLVQGPPGPQGPAGSDGPQGPPGPPGDVAVDAINAQIDTLMLVVKELETRLEEANDKIAWLMDGEYVDE